MSWGEEIELIKKWVKEREDFINEQDKTKAAIIPGK